MDEDESNELSWLKSGAKTSGERQAQAVSPRPGDNKDAPSWLFEENDSKSGSVKDTPTEQTPPKSTLSKLAGGIKWKQPINRVAPADEEDESDSCCCCCPSDPMLCAFMCFHFTAGFVGVTALAANIYVFTRPDLSPKDAIMRCYALLFCALVVVIELDWRFVVNKIRFVDWWVFRGLFYTLVGFVTFGITDTTEKVSSTPQEIVGIMLWAVGICYIVMGTFCMKSMKQRRMIELLRQSQARRESEDAGSVV